MKTEVAGSQTKVRQFTDENGSTYTEELQNYYTLASNQISIHLTYFCLKTDN